MIVAQAVLAIVAGVCAYMVLAALATPLTPMRAAHDGRAYASAVAFVCVTVLVFAAERGWYS